MAMWTTGRKSTANRVRKRGSSSSVVGRRWRRRCLLSSGSQVRVLPGALTPGPREVDWTRGGAAAPTTVQLRRLDPSSGCRRPTTSGECQGRELTSHGCGSFWPQHSSSSSSALGLRRRQPGRSPGRPARANAGLQARGRSGRPDSCRLPESRRASPQAQLATPCEPPRGGVCCACVCRATTARSLRRHHRVRSAGIGDPALVLVTSTAPTTSSGSPSARHSKPRHAGRRCVRERCQEDPQLRQGDPTSHRRVTPHSKLSAFDVQGLTAPVSRALFEAVTRRAARASDWTCARSPTSWNETKITYSNAPAAGAVAAWSGAVSSSGWVSIDVTSLVKGNGAVSLALTTASRSEIQLEPRSGCVCPGALDREPEQPAAPMSPRPPRPRASWRAPHRQVPRWPGTPRPDDVGVRRLRPVRRGRARGHDAADQLRFHGARLRDSYTLAVDAYDAAGNRSPKASRWE